MKWCACGGMPRQMRTLLELEKWLRELRASVNDCRNLIEEVQEHHGAYASMFIDAASALLFKSVVRDNILDCHEHSRADFCFQIADDAFVPIQLKCRTSRQAMFNLNSYYDGELLVFVVWPFFSHVRIYAYPGRLVVGNLVVDRDQELGEEFRVADEFQRCVERCVAQGYVDVRKSFEECSLILDRKHRVGWLGEEEVVRLVPGMRRTAVNQLPFDLVFEEEQTVQVKTVSKVDEYSYVQRLGLGRTRKPFTRETAPDFVVFCVLVDGEYFSQFLVMTRDELQTEGLLDGKGSLRLPYLEDASYLRAKFAGNLTTDHLEQLFRGFRTFNQHLREIPSRHDVPHLWPQCWTGLQRVAVHGLSQNLTAWGCKVMFGKNADLEVVVPPSYRRLLWVVRVHGTSSRQWSFLTSSDSRFETLEIIWSKGRPLGA